MSKISELSDGGSLVSSDYLIAVRSGGNVKVRMDQINVDQIDLGDNEFIRLGNSQDLTIVHAATQSIINQAGIGDLLIQKAGSTKLTVNSSGIDVTGTVTADGVTSDGNISMSGAGTGARFLLLGSETGTYAGSLIMQAGGGSAAFGGSIIAYGHSHASKAGDIVAGISSGSGGSFRVNTSGVDTGGDVLVVETGGNVGIGVAAPLDMLHLKGADPSIRFEDTSGDAYAKIEADSADEGSIRIQADVGNSGANSIIRFDIDGGEKARLTTTGLGIGTASPDQLLQLGSETYAANAIIKTQVDGSDAGDFDAGLHMRSHNDDFGGSIVLESRSATNDLINFKYHNNSAAGVSAMVIDATNGNVGIGISEPTYRIEAAATSGGNGLKITRGADSFFEQFQSTTGGVALAASGSAGYLALRTGTTAGTTTERMRLDSSGNLLVGKTSSDTNVEGSVLFADSSSGAAGAFTSDGIRTIIANRKTSDGEIISIRKDGTTVGSIGADGGSLVIGGGDVGIGFYQSADALVPINGGTRALRDAAIDLGTSSAKFKDLYLSGDCRPTRVITNNSGDWGMEMQGATIARIRFHTSAGGSGEVGSVTVSTTSTAYNTSSDYRLKENVVAITGATDRLKQLKPSRFNFIADADTTVDGFLAHEVQDVVPEAITGAKDAMRDEEYEVTPAVLDDDGNVITEAVMGTRSVPDYQGIDQSKLVPLLVATIQELEARIAALES